MKEKKNLAYVLLFIILLAVQLVLARVNHSEMTLGFVVMSLFWATLPIVAMELVYKLRARRK